MRVKNAEASTHASWLKKNIYTYMRVIDFIVVIALAKSAQSRYDR